jgi:hypothetical protein
MARRRPSTVGPSSSTGIGTGSRPSAATRSMRLAQAGSSTPTRSPGRVWLLSSAPWRRGCPR